MLQSQCHMGLNKFLKMTLSLNLISDTNKLLYIGKTYLHPPYLIYLGLKAVNLAAAQYFKSLRFCLRDVSDFEYLKH